MKTETVPAMQSESAGGPRGPRTAPQRSATGPLSQRVKGREKRWPGREVSTRTPKPAVAEGSGAGFQPAPLAGAVPASACGFKRAGGLRAGTVPRSGSGTPVKGAIKS